MPTGPARGRRFGARPVAGSNRIALCTENLKREVYEETGLDIEVGEVAMINEFHDPEKSFHQVEVFFRASLSHAQLDDTWTDPEGIVVKRRFFL